MPKLYSLEWGDALTCFLAIIDGIETSRAFYLSFGHPLCAYLDKKHARSVFLLSHAAQQQGCLQLDFLDVVVSELPEPQPRLSHPPRRRPRHRAPSDGLLLSRPAPVIVRWGTEAESQNDLFLAGQERIQAAAFGEFSLERRVAGQE